MACLSMFLVLCDVDIGVSGMSVSSMGEHRCAEVTLAMSVCDDTLV